MLGSSIRATPSNTLVSTAAYDIPDDILFSLGNDKDQVMLNRSTILAADTALTSVLIGTPESQAIAADSLMISNITASGDMAAYVNKGGASQMVFWADGSTGDTALMAASGQSVDMYLGGSKVFDLSSDGAKTTLIGLSGDYWQIGTQATDTSHSLNSANDLFVVGDFEVKVNAWVDGAFVVGGNLTCTYLQATRVPDDIKFGLGTHDDFQFRYETADADAKILLLTLDESDDSGNNIPVFLFGEYTNLENVNLGWFDALTEPGFAVANLAGDAYVMLDAGDINGSPAGVGLYFKAAADEDVNILKLSVTGTPTIIWDESEDIFNFNKGAEVPQLNYGAKGSLTIATGVVTATKSNHSIVVEGGTGNGADSIDTINGVQDGKVLFISPATSGANDTVTVTDDGNIVLAGAADFIMDHVNDLMTLKYDTSLTKWVEASRSSNS